MIQCLCRSSSVMAKKTIFDLELIEKSTFKTVPTASANGMLLVFLVVIIMIFTTALLFGLGQRQHEVYYLSDNLWCDRYAYLIKIKTGFSRSAGTTSNITIRLKGVDMNLKSRPHVLNFPDPSSSLLQRHNDDYFVLTTEKHLGELQGVELWHDSIGFSPTWLCNEMTILDLQVHDKYYFRVHHNFRVSQKNSNYCFTRVLSKRTSKESQARHETFARELTGLSLDWYKMATLSASTCLVTIVASMIISSYPSWSAEDIYVRYSQYGYEFKYTAAILFGALISFIIHLSLAYLFRNSAGQFHDRETVATQYSFKITVLCWILVILLICGCITHLLLFDSWIPVTNTFFIVGVIVSLLVQAAVYFRMYSIMRSCFAACSKQKIQEVFITFVLEQIESQRDFLYSKLGGMGLRPYLNHLYIPTAEKNISMKKIHEEILVKLIELIEDGIMVIVYMIVLHYILFLDKVEIGVFSRKIIMSMLKSDDTQSKADFTSNFGLYEYFNDSFIEMVFPTEWYEMYPVTNPYIYDYKNVLFVAPRIRMVRVKPKSCEVLKQMQYLNTTCISNFRIDKEDKWHYNVSWKGGDVHKGTPSMWSYSSPMETGAMFTEAKTHGYPAGGYVVQIHPDRKSSRDMLNYLKEHYWLDVHMRYVEIEMLLYNVNSNLFTVCFVSVERGSSGYFDVKLEVSNKHWLFVNDEIKCVLFLLFTIVILWLALITFKKMSGLTRSLATFLKDIWNAVDLTILLMSLICITLIMLRTSIIGDFLISLSAVNFNRFVPYYHLLRLDDIIEIIALVVIICAAIRLWKLLRFGRVFRIMETTLIMAAPPLCCGILCHVVITSAFSLLGVLLFGTESVNFRGSVHETITTMLLLSVKMAHFFDYTAFKAARHGLGYIFFTVYLTVMLMLYNVYKTIVIMSYSKAKQYFSNELAFEYTTKDYIKDNFIRLFRKKTRLQAGCSTVKQKVFPKADEFRFANGYFVATNQMVRMQYLTLCYLRNALKRKDLSGRLDEYDIILIQRVLDSMYGKKLSWDTKELFFKGQIVGQNVEFVDENRISLIETVVNAMLLTGDERAVMSDKENFYRKKMKKGLRHIDYIRESLKDIEIILNNIEIGRQRF